MEGSEDGTRTFEHKHTIMRKPKTVEQLATVLKEAGVVANCDSAALAFWKPGPLLDALRVDRLLDLREDLEWMVTDSEEAKADVSKRIREMEERLLTHGFTCKPVELKRLDRPAVVHFEEDMVVVVSGAEALARLDDTLRLTGQCIPHASLANKPILHSWLAATTVEGAISMNLPHALESQHGSWKDWILGMTLMLADGTVVKTGSKVVKSVAGYDVHKLMIGARGAFAIVVDVTLRTFPVASLAKSEVETFVEVPKDLVASVKLRSRVNWIQRTRPTDFSSAVRGAKPYLTAADHASSTLWAIIPQYRELDRFPHDWVLRAGCGEKNLVIDDPVLIELIKRTKAIFDPTDKLNPGALGFV